MFNVDGFVDVVEKLEFLMMSDYRILCCFFCVFEVFVGFFDNVNLDDDLILMVVI